MDTLQSYYLLNAGAPVHPRPFLSLTPSYPSSVLRLSFSSFSSTSNIIRYVSTVLTTSSFIVFFNSSTLLYPLAFLYTRTDSSYPVPIVVTFTACDIISCFSISITLEETICCEPHTIINLGKQATDLIRSAEHKTQTISRLDPLNLSKL